MTSLFGREAMETLALSHPEWESMADEEQVNVSHHRCEDTGMTDHRARLYIKYTDGAYVFMCHNCGVHGMYRPKERASMLREEVIAPFGVTTARKLQGEWALASCEGSVPLWLLEHGFDFETCRYYTIKWDTKGIYLPIYDDALGDIVGVQRRNYTGKPKYTTEVTSKFSGYCYLCRNHPKDGDTLYITEDLLSCYKLHAAGKSALAVMGTKTPTNMPRDYKRVTIWLDNDAAGHKGAINMVRELSSLYSNVSTMFEKEAKTWTLEELIKLP